MGRRIPMLVVSLLLLLGTSGAALGVTTVSRTGNVITVTGDDGPNVVEIVGSSSGPVVFKDASGITPGGECTVVDAANAACGAPGPGLVANVSLGGGNDIFQPETIITTFPVVVVDLGPGDDTSWGSAGNDTINGGAGVDNINARAGQDTIDGGPGNDRLEGAAGDDVVTGGPGTDSIFGDGEFSLGYWGNDTLKAQDGEIDNLSCSLGADTAVADANDVFDVLGDCESRTIAPGATPPAATPPPAPAALNVGLAAPSVPKLSALLSGKKIKTRVNISAPCDLAVGLVVLKAEAKRLKLGQKDVVIGAAAGKIDSAGAYDVTLPILKKFRAKLRGQARVRISVVAVCEAADKTTDIAARKVVLKG